MPGPFQRSLVVVVPDNAHDAQQSFDIPSGERLVIESVSVEARLYEVGIYGPRPSAGIVIRTTLGGGDPVPYFVPLQEQGVGWEPGEDPTHGDPGRNYYVGFEATRLYADGQVIVQFLRTLARYEAKVTLSLSGQLISP